MASQGPLGAGTGANVSPGPGNDALGAWVNPGNITADDANYAVNTNNTGSGHVDLSCKIVKGGTIGGNDKAVGTAINLTTDTTLSYGGAADLWGNTLTDSDVNDSTFGVAWANKSTGGSGSNWLKATNFGFSIPSGATIDGVTAGVKCHRDSTIKTFVTYITLTVNYTESAAGQPAGRRMSQSRYCSTFELGREGGQVA